MEVKVPPKDELVAQFEREYVSPAAALMDQFHVAHGVVASNNITHFRQIHSDFHGKTLVIHQFRSPEHFQEFYQNGKYFFYSSTHFIYWVSQKFCNILVIWGTIQ